jgi:Ca2+-binding RTX toxin-like protein
MSKRALFEACEARRFLAAQTLNMTSASESLVMWRDSNGYHRFGPSVGVTYYFDGSGSNPSTTAGTSGTIYRFDSSYTSFTLNLSGGNDSFLIDTGVVQGSIVFTVNGGLGQDSITGGNNNDTITGSDSVDSLVGGGSNDYIDGGDQADFIDGSVGSDEIHGGSGGDTILGGKNNDTIFGDGGSDEISAGIGNDSVMGGDDQDTLYGGDGDDFLQGGSGTDHLFGEAGADYLSTAGDGYVDFIYSLNLGEGDTLFADGGDVLVP